MSRLLKMILFVTLCILMHSAGNTWADSPKTITPAEWQRLKNDKELNYKNDREGAPKLSANNENALTKAIVAIIRFFGGAFGYFLAWLFVLIVVIYIVNKLVVQKGSFFFGKSNKKMDGPETEQVDAEDISGTNWQELLQKALSNNDQRLAVRYRYMWLLQLLQNSSLIVYRTDKTNYDYYNELSESTYKQPFRQLSRLYEYAWYGNFHLNEISSNEFDTLFDNLKKQIGR